ncbi:YhcN/YlaJ family sporulation lipoprotein [Paenibacillus sp. HW567]|uniref:YhcN/YlaJ family sporulation lipoprotein n=1 Tax=Paenibacillus sp. HW567 TaxID=1034769 RepID=UPI00037437FA|nr:YhcN/YlaJ family sporulation lipoprotein [Paenibacillus sp. HW567]
MLRSKISLSVSAALLLGMVTITGCGANNTAMGNVQTKSVRGMHDGRLNVKAVPGTNVNNFDSMEMSQDLANRIAAMPEIRSAHVMLAGKSAYVAVALNEASAGTHATSITGRPSHLNNYTGMGRPSGILPGTRGTATTPGVTGMGNPSGMLPGTRGTVTGTPGMTGMGGSMTGVPGQYTGRGTVGGTGMVTPTPGTYVGNNTVDGRHLKHDLDVNMGTAAGTRTITPNNTIAPYSTNNVTHNDRVTTELKNKIADEVKKHHKGIDNVYVSANPDFVQRANFYADEVRAGHPLKGFANEFRIMVERIFPTRSGY